MSQESEKKNEKKASCAKPLTAGLIGWVLGFILLLAAAWPIIHPEVFSIAALWALSHWWIAFLFGAVVLVTVGFITRQPFGTDLLSYLLPVCILVLISGVFIMIYPDTTFRSDLLGSLGAICLFQAVGLIWISVKKSESGKSRLTLSVLPAVFGGLVILTMLAVPVFTSNSFIYRNAFTLAVTKTSLSDGAVLADAVLEIKKPGSYRFSAPRYNYLDNATASVDEGFVELGKITWGSAGAPGEKSVGSYPFQIRWEKSVPKSQEDFNRSIETDNPIYLEVHDTAKTEGDFLYSIYASAVAKGN